MKPQAKKKNSYLYLSAISFLVILAVWCIITYGGFVKPMFVPSPTAVFQKLVSQLKDGSLWLNCWASTRRVMVGWLLSVVVALPCGMIMARSPKFTAIVQPIIEFVRYLPVVALVPLTILYLGIGEDQKYIGLIGLATDFLLRCLTKILVPWHKRLSD